MLCLARPHCSSRTSAMGSVLASQPWKPQSHTHPTATLQRRTWGPASSCASTSSEVAVVRAARELSMSRGLTGRLPIFSPTFSWSPACGDSASTGHGAQTLNIPKPKLRSISEALADRRSVGRSTSLMLTWASLLTADWLREISPGQLNCGTAEALASEGGSGCSGS